MFIMSSRKRPQHLYCDDRTPGRCGLLHGETCRALARYVHAFIDGSKVNVVIKIMIKLGFGHFAYSPDGHLERG